MSARGERGGSVALPWISRAAFGAVLGVARAVACLPWLTLAVPGTVVGLLAGSALRVRRRAVERAMSRARLPAPTAARRMYAELGRALLELLWLMGASARRRRHAVRRAFRLADSAAVALRTALDRGPVVVAASHTANWEVSAFGAADWLAQSGRRLAVVAKRLHVKALDAACTRLRLAAGLEVLRPEGALGAAREALVRGDVVVMPMDQVPLRRRHGLEASFLGATALCDRAPAALAYRARATFLVVAAHRARGKQHLEVVAVMHPDDEPGATPSDWIDRATRDASRALEQFVLRHPASWLWLHRRWRAPRESARLVPSSELG